MFRWNFVLILFFFGACKTASQVKKTENVGFSVPKTALKEAAKFADSKYRRDMSMLDFPPNQPPHTRKDVMVLTPDMPYDWRGLLNQNKNIRYFLVTPGDYRKWGYMRPAVSGTANQPYIFRYYDPQSTRPYDAPHPVQRKKQGKEAVLERFHFNGVSHYVLHGLTFRGQSKEKEGRRGGWYNAFLQESNHNTLDFCLIEKVLKGNGVRIFNSNDNTVQRCVIRDKIEGSRGDNIGVTVYASEGKESRDNRILDNEIYNVTDGVQLVYEVETKRNALITGEVPGTIIDNNDLYITPKLHRETNGEVLACAEEGVDIKVGTISARPEDKVRVINNRIWGFRTTDKTCSGGGHGSGMVIHRTSKNLLIENNVIFDVSRGLSIAHGHHIYENERVGKIKIRNNILYDIQGWADNAGYAIVLGADILVESNTIRNAKKYLHMPSKQPARFRKNLILDSRQGFVKANKLSCTIEDNLWLVKKTAPEASRVNKTNRVSLMGQRTDLKNYTFYIKRWTGPTQKTIPKVILP